jgi:hypothetical protein
VGEVTSTTFEVSDQMMQSDAIAPIPFNGKHSSMMKQLDVANQSSLLSPLEPFITYALTVLIKMPICYTPGELPIFPQVVNLDFMNTLIAKGFINVMSSNPAFKETPPDKPSYA